jgi:hypothetical protein
LRAGLGGDGSRHGDVRHRPTSRSGPRPHATRPRRARAVSSPAQRRREGRGVDARRSGQHRSSADARRASLCHAAGSGGRPATSAARGPRRDRGATSRSGSRIPGDAVVGQPRSCAMQLSMHITHLDWAGAWELPKNGQPKLGNIVPTGIRNRLDCLY